jgi:hypothetical protein
MGLMIKVSLTHKGWFGLCPVYYGGVYSASPVVVERHWSAVPLMMLSEGFFALAILTMAVLAPQVEPAYPLRLTGKLEPGREVFLPLNQGA